MHQIWSVVKKCEVVGSLGSVFSCLGGFSIINVIMTTQDSNEINLEFEKKQLSNMLLNCIMTHNTESFCLKTEKDINFSHYFIYWVNLRCSRDPWNNLLIFI